MKNWAKYGGYEGPFLHGTIRMAAPGSSSDFWMKSLYVTTSTEGGCYDAINMYDRCIISPGLIQVCEQAPIFGASDLFGGIADRCGEGVLTPLRSVIKSSGAEFKKSAKKWRFYLDGSPISTQDQQRLILLGGSSGKEGEWAGEQRVRASEVATAVAEMLRQPNTIEAHTDYARKRLPAYVVPNATKFWLNSEGQPSKTSWELFGPDWEAAFAGYVSFGVNKPTPASKMLAEWILVDAAPGERHLFSLLRKLTVGPGIAIYPARYKAIGKAIKQLWDIDLPELVETAQFARSLPEAQQMLIDAGYNLGPHGADGVDGTATQKALREFQVNNDLPQTGEFDRETMKKLESASA